MITPRTRINGFDYDRFYIAQTGTKDGRLEFNPETGHVLVMIPGQGIKQFTRSDFWSLSSHYEKRYKEWVLSIEFITKRHPVKKELGYTLGYRDRGAQVFANRINRKLARLRQNSTAAPH